jgi:hypothetical protein
MTLLLFKIIFAAVQHTYTTPYRKHTDGALIFIIIQLYIYICTTHSCVKHVFIYFPTQLLLQGRNMQCIYICCFLGLTSLNIFFCWYADRWEEVKENTAALYLTENELILIKQQDNGLSFKT